MLTPEECALAEAISDHLIELYVRRDEACREDNRIPSISSKQRVLADLIAKLETLRHNHPDRRRLNRMIAGLRSDLELLCPQEENLLAAPWRPAWPFDYRGR